MTSRIDKVIAILKYLGLKPNIKEYKWRFIIQKVTFLAQSIGTEIGYYFTIYVAGPYSPALAKDYYEERNRVESLETKYVLSKKEKNLLDRFKGSRFLSGNLEFMECVSTIVHHLKEHPNLMDDELLSSVRKLKPYLSEYLCLSGLNEAKRLLFKSEYLTKELKEEIDAWDRID